MFGVQARWPNPEQSIGKFIRMSGRKQCWKAVGPARKRYDILAEEIKKYLNRCIDPIPGSEMVAFSVYMIGTTAQKASPVIMFGCEDAKARKKVHQAVRTSSLLDAFPGFSIANAAVLPDLGRLDLLTLRATAEQAEEQSDTQRYRVTINVARNEMLIKSDHGSAWSKSTLGGIAYIFTAGHPFEEDVLEDSQKEPETGDQEWEMDDDSDVDLDVRVCEATFMEGLSRASNTPPDFVSEATDRSEVDSSEDPGSLSLFPPVSGTRIQDPCSAELPAKSFRSISIFDLMNVARPDSRLFRLCH